MFWRVPGPAEREATVETVSAYGSEETDAQRRDDRHGRLRAAGHEVDLARVWMSGEVDGRHDRRPERRGSQVDAANPALGEQPGVLGMGRRRGRVEHQLDVIDALQQLRQATARDDVAALAWPCGSRRSPGRCRPSRQARALGLRSTLNIRSVPMLPVPMIPTRSARRAELIWPAASSACGAAAAGSGPDGTARAAPAGAR